MSAPQEVLAQKIQEQGDLVRKLKAAKESPEKGGRPKSRYNIEELDKLLAEFSYICGYTPSKSDVEVMKDLEKLNFEKHIFIKRWWYHMRSFNNSEISKFPETPPPRVIFNIQSGTKVNLDQKVGDYKE